MKLIIGLGNPGKEYERTRHNAGFLALDHIAAASSERTFTFDKKSTAEICKTTLDEKRIILVKPQTFMNLSGQSVRALLDFYKLTTADLIVIHDDKDFPIGALKIQQNRGPAGHNGVSSIIEHVGTQDFLRFRVGVAPADRTIHDTADFVLGKFTADEQHALEKVFGTIVQEIKKLL